MFVLSWFYSIHASLAFLRVHAYINKNIIVHFQLQSIYAEFSVLFICKYISHILFLIIFALLFIQVDEIIETLHVSKEKLVDIQGRMTSEMIKGLGKATNPTAKVKMFPTYVRSLPTGQGKYYVRRKSLCETLREQSLFMRGGIEDSFFPHKSCWLVIYGTTKTTNFGIFCM